MPVIGFRDVTLRSWNKATNLGLKLHPQSQSLLLYSTIFQCNLIMNQSWSKKYSIASAIFLSQCFTISFHTNLCPCVIIRALILCDTQPFSSGLVGFSLLSLRRHHDTSVTSRHFTRLNDKIWCDKTSQMRAQTTLTSVFLLNKNESEICNNNKWPLSPSLFLLDVVSGHILWPFHYSSIYCSNDTKL